MHVDRSSYKEFISKPEAEIKTLILIGDEQAEAYAWLKAYAENLDSMCSGGSDDEDNYYGSVTLDDLIETGMSHVETTSSWGGDYLSRGGAFESMSVDPTFWDKLAALFKIDIPGDRRGSFFSCSC